MKLICDTIVGALLDARRYPVQFSSLGKMTSDWGGAIMHLAKRGIELTLVFGVAALVLSLAPTLNAARAVEPKPM